VGQRPNDGRTDRLARGSAETFELRLTSQCQKEDFLPFCVGEKKTCLSESLLTVFPSDRARDSAAPASRDEDSDGITLDAGQLIYIVELGSGPRRFAYLFLKNSGWTRALLDPACGEAKALRAALAPALLTPSRRLPRRQRAPRNRFADE